MTQDKSEKLESIVLLLRRPKRLNVYALANVLNDVFGCSFKTVDENSAANENDRNEAMGKFWVAGVSPHFIVNADTATFTSHDIPAPYFDDPITACEQIVAPS